MAHASLGRGICPEASIHQLCLGNALVAKAGEVKAVHSYAHYAQFNTNSQKRRQLPTPTKAPWGLVTPQRSPAPAYIDDV